MHSPMQGSCSLSRRRTGLRSPLRSKVAATRAPALATAVLVNRADEHTGLAAYRAVRGGAERFLGRAPAWAGAVAEEEPLRAAIEETRLLRTDTAALHSLARLVTQDPATARLRVT